MGSGKSTHAKTLAADNCAVLISEDDWLSAHYPNQIKSFDDYLMLSATIKPFIKSHVQCILNTGVSVVMDFPGNTVKQRQWLKRLCDEIHCSHELTFLDVSNEQCLGNIAKRRLEQPQRAQFDTEAVFAQVTQFFEPPVDKEKLNIVLIANEA